MELNNEFRVDAAPERVWAVLTDVELIAPCMPGAQLQEVDGDEYRGVVKVKVGPITAQYQGVARFAEQDAAGRRAVLHAEGRETRGQGNARATVTAQLVPDGDGTRVTVVTDLSITGRVAQFGRGVIADVSAKLLTQFVDCLEQKLAPESAAPESPADADPGESSEVRTRPLAQPSEVAPVDLLGTAGVPVAKRILPVALGLLTLAWLRRRWRRRRLRRRGEGH